MTPSKSNFAHQTIASNYLGKNWLELERKKKHTFKILHYQNKDK
jgi:hypothetical protein